MRNTRCEFGLEIHVVSAFLVYQIGVSIDQVREMLRFFARLDMSKAQADSPLNQLAADWDADFDALCELMARAAVLCLDETGWKVDKRTCYTWIFTTISHVVFLCGKGSGGDVLGGILPKDFASGSDKHMHPAGDSPQIPGSESQSPPPIDTLPHDSYAIGWLAVSPAQAENRQLPPAVAKSAAVNKPE